MQVALPKISVKLPSSKQASAKQASASALAEEFDPSTSAEIEGRVPRTQDLIDIVGARDDCLILRDATVIAAVGFSSIDDTLLTDDDIAIKLELYYDLLVTLRFPVQFLITTRPQDLSPYFSDLLLQRDRHDVMRNMVERFASRIPSFVRNTNSTSLIGLEGFVSHFGWHPNNLIGMPGLARRIAWQLCDVEKVTLLRDPTQMHEAQEDKINKLCDAARTTCGWLTRWRRVLSEQIELVQTVVRKAQSPVRRYYLVVSHNQRIKTAMLPNRAISDHEFQRASARVAEYCRQIAAGIDAMGLTVWRATQDDLLLDVRTFFNPSQSILAGRKQRLMEQGAPLQED
ncbi:MAG: hypothetical protein HC853_00020 [Anaerolineae bacterium]|nr:hypothetical protein [Anaerolineae bacterium]